MTDWRPIASCKEKGEVLLYWPAKVTGAYKQTKLQPMMRVGRLGDTPHREPSHWMPLPKAPEPTPQDS